jgi:hypothetical protein
MAEPVTAAHVAHLIEHLLRSPCLKPTWRLRVLDYVRAGFNSDGQRINRSDDLDRQMKTMECEECTEDGCRDECPVKPYRELLRRGDCAAVMTE